MKRLVAVCAVVGLLFGCSSAPKQQEGAKVEERKPVVTQPTQPTTPSKPPAEARTAPTKPQAVAADPLKDPSNILSRRSVYFDFDSNVVKDEFKPLVTSHAKYLSQHTGRHVKIQGNTDERGSREYNIALGQRRADAVKQMMTLLGAGSSQIETVSFGEEKPRAQGHDETAWAENRRADIVYDGE